MGCLRSVGRFKRRCGTDFAVIDNVFAFSVSQQAESTHFERIGLSANQATIAGVGPATILQMLFVASSLLRGNRFEIHDDAVARSKLGSSRFGGIFARLRVRFFDFGGLLNLLTLRGRTFGGGLEEGAGAAEFRLES